MRLLGDERGAVYPYLMFWIVIIFCGFIWIAMNEVILNVGDWQITSATEDPSFTWPILLTLFRMTPMVIILSTFIWAIVQSHRGEAAY